MKTAMKEITEKELQHEIIEALERAEAEGQPVQDIFEAVKRGQELEVWFEAACENRCQLVISVKER